MLPCPTLESDRVILAPIGAEDVTLEYLSWINDPEVSKTRTNAEKTSFEDLKKYVFSRKAAQNIWFWKILLRESKRHIGNLKLEPIDFEKKLAWYGIMIGARDCWGKGYATEATILSLKAAFDIAKIDTMYLGVYHENIPAIKVYRNCGFTECVDVPAGQIDDPNVLFMEKRRSK